MDEQLVESVRQEAAEEAKIKSLQRSINAVNEIIDDNSFSSLEPIKQCLRRSKKKMRTCSYYLCDKCNQPILDPEDGFIFHGNVYVANPATRGGIIGNNFPTSGEPFGVEDVEETVFCHKCIFDVLRLNKHYQKINTNTKPQDQAFPPASRNRTQNVDNYRF